MTPIDAVITWVDGNDRAMRQRLEAYLASLGRPRPRSADPTRFDDAGELAYCIASILRFAPWFRRIHIVTDRQTPALMSKFIGTPWAQRVRVIDHCEIFAGYEQHLPTFNSRAIISMLWRIRELAEHFVYFNDDFIVLREVSAEDFFRGDAVVMRGHWRAQSGYRWPRRIVDALKRLHAAAEKPDRAGNHTAQELSAKLAGFERRYYRLYHNPFPMRRSTLAAFFDAHPTRLDDNISHRLRSSQQFKAESLATHLEIAQENAILDNRLHVAQLKPAEQAAWRLRAKLRRADRDPSCAFACVQSLDLTTPAVRRDVVAWLDRRVGSLDTALALPLQT